MTVDNDDALSVFSLASDTSVTSAALELVEPDSERPANIGAESPEDKPALKQICNPSCLDRHPNIPLHQRHHRFFIPEEFISLKVDSVYFNIPSFILKESSKKIREIIERGENVDQEVASLLEGLTAVDLERFLGVVFLRNFQEWDFATVDEWTSILKVAHQWEAESIYRLALEQIEPDASAVEFVVLGSQYHIPGWLQRGRLQLCRREEPLSLEEANRMGMDEAIKISAARQNIRPSKVLADVKDETILDLLGEKGVDEDVKNLAKPKPAENLVENVENVETSSSRASNSPLEVQEVQPLSSEKVTKPSSTHEPQATTPVTKSQDIPSGATTNPETQPSSPTVPKAPQVAKGQSGQSIHNVATQESLTIRVVSAAVSRPVRITRALELRRRLHNLDNQVGKLESGAAAEKRKTQVIEDRTKLKEELTRLFEGFNAVEALSNHLNLAGMTGRDAAALLEGSLEQHLRPGMTATKIILTFSKKRLEQQENHLYEMLTRYGLKYTWDPSKNLKAFVEIPVHGCLPRSA